MAPKKKEQQKMSLGDFLTDNGFGGGSWADEVEETYGTQPLPASDRPRYGGNATTSTSAWQDRGYSVRETVPQRFPDKPPYTAHLGNLSYDATTETVTEFFEGCDIVSVRIIEDREMQRPKGFGYVEFTNADGLKKALDLDGESFQGRMIKIKIADPPRGGDSRMDSSRDLSDWTRKGPLPELPGRGGSRSGGPDFGGDRERRTPRDPAAESRAPREMNWERRGPLAPLPPQEGGPGPRDGSRSRAGADGLGERGGSHRGSRQGSASWGEGRQDPARPRREQQPERASTAAEKDFQWRSNMRPDAAKEDPDTLLSPTTVTAPPPAPAGRPRLNLQKRTVSEAPDVAATPSSDAKASPFGAARPIDTAAREQEIEQKRQVAIREKKEADEKAKEEKRLAKLAAAEAEKEEAAAREAAAEEKAAKAAEVAAAELVKNGEVTETNEKQETAPAEQKEEARSREPRETKEAPPIKTKANESVNWRSGSGDQRAPRASPGGGRGGRGAPRGPRNDGRGARQNGVSAPQSPVQGTDEGDSTPVDDDGWTKVKKGRQGRPLAS